MFKRILVPLDGSPLAEGAIAVAAKLARVGDGVVVLVRVVRAPIEYESALLTTPGWIPAADLQERDEATKYLAEIQVHDDLTGIASERHVLTGAPASLISESAQAREADLIVMTQHGRSGFSRWALGSVAAEVVRTARTPVLVLRDGESLIGSREAVHADVGPSHVLSTLVALDGSPLAEAALEPAIQLAAALAAPEPATLHLLRIVDMGRGPGVLAFTAGIPDTMARLSEARAQELSEAEAYLSDLATHVRANEREGPAVTVTWSVVRSSDIAGAIVRTSEGGAEAASEGALLGSVDYGVIALATHGRGGLKRWLMGSVTETVLQRAQRPVLSVRPHDVPASPNETNETIAPSGTPATS